MAERDSAGVVIPPPLIYAAGILAAWLLKVYVAPLNISDSLGSRSVLLGFAVSFLTIGFGILAWAFRTFRRAETSILPVRPTTTIVEAGPFQLTRNPMYVALAFIYLGVGSLVSWSWSIVLLPVVLTIVNFYVIRKEERYLSAKFGREYDEYRARVRRWI